MSLKKKKTTSVATQDAIAELFTKLETEKCDPITELARLAMEDTTPLSDRINILKDLAGYTAPKRRAIDVTFQEDTSLVVKIIKYTKDTKGQVKGMLKEPDKNPDIESSEISDTLTKQTLPGETVEPVVDEGLTVRATG